MVQDHFATLPSAQKNFMSKICLRLNLTVAIPATNAINKQSVPIIHTNF